MAAGSGKKSLYLNILITMTSFLVAIILVELILRFLVIKDSSSNNFLFISKPALQDQEKKFGFKENATIREVGIYWHDNKFQIEYDSSFTTNNIGLVQKNPFDPHKEALVVVGDSFTQGTGAVPWFYKLEAHWQNRRYQLINLGIIGTGMEQWQALLHWFAEFGKMKHIFICFISNDWERLRWVVREDTEFNGFKFIPWDQRNDRVHNQKLTIYYMDNDTSSGTLLERADILKKALSKNFLKSYSIVKKVIIDGKLSYNSAEEMFRANTMAFEQIIAHYGSQNLTFFHIPEKGEVIQGAYSPLGERLKKLILAHNLDYIDGLALCHLTEKDFLKLDGHPNASGYNKIYECFLTQALNRLNLPD